MNSSFQPILDKVRSLFPGQERVFLHEPIFKGNEKKYILDAIDSTFVSSVGAYVDRFEKMMTDITGAKYAVATVNGTSALHLSLMVCDVRANDEVISQSLTFIATANAISYLSAKPVFIDVDKDTMGMSPEALERFLEEFGERKDDGYTYNKTTGRRIKACVPMHTFGFPCRTKALALICKEWNIDLVEDTAESLGSYSQGRHTGLDGKVAAFSFNGNKTVTCGGGGALITNDEDLAKRAKHLSTQAKVPHPWEFTHDSVGYNYRMPNLNAALACAQLEQLPAYLESKRKLAEEYEAFFADIDLISFVKETEETAANYWLNCILFSNAKERNDFLKYSNENNIMCRPVWELMNNLEMFKAFQSDELFNSKWLAERLVNIPSSARI